MQVVLLRVGIDARCGGIQGPISADGSFEYLPIPDEFNDCGIDKRTYGNVKGRLGRYLLDYFPESMRSKRAGTSLHFDPEFDTFTYGDPTPLKAGLRHLVSGDLLVFYAGLQGWRCDTAPGLYIVGYFRVALAGLASEFTASQLSRYFAHNFHVRHKLVLKGQRDCLVLVKGGPGSRLLKKAHLISSMSLDRSGRALKILSPAMRKIFGDWDGHLSIQRCPPRWVAPDFVSKASSFIRSLR